MNKFIFSAIIFLICRNAQSQENYTIEWQKNYNADNSQNHGMVCCPYDYDIRQFDANNYIVVGSKNIYNPSTFASKYDDYWAAKIDNNGSIKWEKNYGSSFYDNPNHVFLATNEILITGNVEAQDDDVNCNAIVHNYTDPWFIKLDSTGSLKWKKCYSGRSDSRLFDCQKTPEGGYIFVGDATTNYIPGYHSGDDGWIIKYDNNFNEVFNKAIGGSSGDVFNKVVVTRDSGYLVVGSYSSPDGDIIFPHVRNSSILSKFSKDGTYKWYKNFDSLPTSSFNIVHALETNDSGYLLLCNRLNDINVIKLDKNRAVLWSKTYGGTGNDQAVSIQPAGNDFIILGNTSSSDGDLTQNNGGTDFWILKIDQQGNKLYSHAFGSNADDNLKAVLQINNGMVLVGSQQVSVSKYLGLVIKLNKQQVTMINTKANFSDEINIYPNPTNNFISVSMELTQTLPVSISIWSIEGMHLLQRNYNNAISINDQIDLSSCSAGIYVLKVESGNESAIYKIVKQ